MGKEIPRLCTWTTLFELTMAGSVKLAEVVPVKHPPMAGNNGEAMIAPTMMMARNSSVVSM